MSLEKMDQHQIFSWEKDLGEYVFEILKILKQFSCIYTYLYQNIQTFGKTKHTNIGLYKTNFKAQI